MKPSGMQESATRAEVACIDCGGGPVCPVFVRQPKEANFARRAGGDERPGDDKYILVRCERCGSVFLHPHYFEEASAVYTDPRYFGDYYPGNIHSGGGPPAGKVELSAYGRWNGRRQARGLLRMAGLDPSVRLVRVADIGCAYGFLVQAFAEEGCDAYGVEVSEQALKAQSKGLNVHHGRFEEAPFEDGYFDLIVANQVVEHIVDLGSLCEALYRTLKPDGRVILAVPNDLEGSRSLIWRRRPWWLIPPMHVRYFTRVSAQRIFARHGFRLERVFTTGEITTTILSPLLKWRLKRTRFRGWVNTKAYKAFMLLFSAVLMPLDWVLTHAGRHNDLMLVLCRTDRPGVRRGF